MKKLLGVVLAVALMVMMVPVGVMAQDERPLALVDVSGRVWLTEDDVVRVHADVADIDGDEQHVLRFWLTAEGRERMREATATLAGEENSRLRVVVFGATISAPFVDREIDSDTFMIYGRMAAELVQSLADEINDAIGAEEQIFSDIAAGHWAFVYVAEMSGAGLINGFPDGTFRPEGHVTRAEFARMLARTAGMELREPDGYFVDVSDDAWFASDIATVRDYLPWGDRTERMLFMPDYAANRAGIVMALVRVKGYDLDSADLSYLEGFADADEWLEGDVAYFALAVQHGLMRGNADNTLRVYQPVTRAEAAALLVRAFRR